LPAARSDEIGTLARAFRSMASRVQESREILEQQVDERTAELRDTLEQLREAQNELLVKERLAMLGQLSGSVGHELRNPLGVMSNAAYLLEKSIEKSPDKAREYAQMIRTQIAHSEKIVSDLLGFTRVRTPERTEVDVGAVISEQVKQLNMPECVRVDVDVQADIPQLYADPVQVGQILQNLLANAAHAAEARAGGGVVTVRAGANDGLVRIDVMDNGTGIRADDMNRIFEPLFTTKARGIGLGLPLSRSLAEANGGQLTIESEFGVGSVATLVLPHAS
jgi:signal transduction histidine kinase